MDEDKTSDNTVSKEESTLDDSVVQDSNEAALSAGQQVEFLVKQLAADIDKIGVQIKEQKQMVTDAFKGDSRYQEVSEKIKDLNQQRMSVQKQLAENDAVRKAKEDLEDLNSERKALEHRLSEYLKQYVEHFDSRTIEDLSGNLKQIVTQHKLVKQKSD